MKNLTELDITGCPNIELEKVLELESLPQLKVLNYGLQHGLGWLNGPYMDDEMPGLMEKLPHLIINKIPFMEVGWKMERSQMDRSQMDIG